MPMAVGIGSRMKIAITMEYVARRLNLLIEWHPRVAGR
jgi:hypothetical protein